MLGTNTRQLLEIFLFVSCLCIYLVSFSFLRILSGNLGKCQDLLSAIRGATNPELNRPKNQGTSWPSCRFPPGWRLGAAFNQHLMVQRPRLPVLPTPVIPLPRGAPLPMVPGIRPPVLPRPVPGASGYAPVPAMPPMIASPGAPSLPGQVSGLPLPPTLVPPSTVPGTGTTPTSSNGTPTTVTPSLYQTNPAAPASGGIENFNASAQPYEAKP